MSAQEGETPEVDAHARFMQRALQALLHPEAHPEESRHIAEELLFRSLPRKNVGGLTTTTLHNAESRDRFLERLRKDGGDATRVRFCWHLTSDSVAAASIEAEGIRCDSGRCACGRYGLGGYVATCATKANAYADAESEDLQRHLFLVVALPGEEVVRGERGHRPRRTAADLPSYPTEFCFVDGARLHCAFRFDYIWESTGRRCKASATVGDVRAWRRGRSGVLRRASAPPRARGV